MLHNDSGRQFHIDYAHLTNQGDRQYNEDSVLTLSNAMPPTFALADGLGGHGFGDVASATVLAAIEQEIAQLAQTASPTAENIPYLFRQAQRSLCEKKADASYGNMMTTLVLLQIGEQVSWGHIGDSRLYYFQNGEIIAHTLDHSVPQVLVYTGEIEASDIRHHPDRNRLLRAMGTEWERGDEFAVAKSIQPQMGQSFLLCSDGFWEHIVEEDMERCLQQSKDAKDWLHHMSRIVQENGKGHQMDNFSAITVQLL